MSKAIEVRAIAQGYYRDSLKMPGDTFTIDDESEAGSWMAHKDGSPFTKKKAADQQVVVIGPGGVLKVEPKADGGVEVLKGAGTEPELLRDANHQGPETVIGTPTPGFDAKEEAEKAAFVEKAKAKAEDAEADPKRKAK